MGKTITRESQSTEQSVDIIFYFSFFITENEILFISTNFDGNVLFRRGAG